MLNIEKQKENFKNHKAALLDYGNIKIVDFKNPESNEYRIRFLFEEDYYRLHISGDLGELIASNYCNMCYEKFSDFVNDTGYFETKVDCHNRAFYRYDEEKAKQELLQHLKDNYYYEEMLEHRYFLDSEEDKIEEFFYDVFCDFEESSGFGPKGIEILTELDSDIYYEVESFGKEETGILDLYMLAFKLAKEQLDKF